jgi:RNA polymerase sigma-70 factor (ECF subfamily)
MPADESLTADQVLDLEQTHECVMRAFESLPDNYRDVYRLREIEGRSAEETARLLKLSVANVKARLHRARVRVREALDRALGA